MRPGPHLVTEEDAGKKAQHQAAMEDRRTEGEHWERAEGSSNQERTHMADAEAHDEERIERDKDVELSLASQAKEEREDPWRSRLVPTMLAPCCWGMHWSEDFKMDYYWHPDTGEATWDRPKEFLG